MYPSQWKTALRAGQYDNVLTALYGSRTEAQKDRLCRALDAFEAHYGIRDVSLFSVPGRSEISGNHTDHNHGRVLAAAVDLDLIAVAAKTNDDCIRVIGEGYDEDVVPTVGITAENAPRYTSSALLAGMSDAFRKAGFAVGGFAAYTTSEVHKGSGLSSSAAFEVMIGSILNHFYAEDRVSAVEIAKMAQYAENAFFGKPCGLMDQMACAVGGFIRIDFADPAAPEVEQIPFDLAAHGYTLCIVNTGGNHADLNEDYAAIPAEMKAVAKELGQPVLRGLKTEDILAAIPRLRQSCGDRAILRALHFTEENDRVEQQTEALRRGDLDAFLDFVHASSASSFRFLQNAYTVHQVREQGISLAIAVTEAAAARWRSGKENTPCNQADRTEVRVHGGGFAGTVQVFLPTSHVEELRQTLDGIFGAGAVCPLSVRPVGAVCLDRGIRE